MTIACYNERENCVCEWLRELINDGQAPENRSFVRREDAEIRDRRAIFDKVAQGRQS